MGDRYPDKRNSNSAAAQWYRAWLAAGASQRERVQRILGQQCHYAISPFVPLHTATGWMLAANLDPPPHLDAEALSRWQPTGEVVLINPGTGLATLASDDSGWIVGNVSPMSLNVKLFINGLAFARAWAAARVEMIDLHKRGNVPGLALRDAPDHCLPGLLLAGTFHTVCSWQPLLDRDRVTVDDPGMVRPLAAALLRAKRVPIVEAQAPRLRKAA